MSETTVRIRRGDIWTVNPPGFPKPRPALVVSINPINDLCPDVLMIPLTTKEGPLRVPLDVPSAVSGLEKTSYAKCESLGPVHKSRLKRQIGRVPPDLVAQVENGVRRVLGL